eukprot:g43608.t1
MCRWTLSNVEGLSCALNEGDGGCVGAGEHLGFMGVECPILGADAVKTEELGVGDRILAGSKMKELVIDFRKQTGGGHIPVCISDAEMKMVKSIKFLEVMIISNLSWFTHINITLKKAEGSGMLLLQDVGAQAHFPDDYTCGKCIQLQLLRDHIRELQLDILGIRDAEHII